MKTDIFPKPVIVVSKCLGFAACRWDAAPIPDDVIKKLKPFVSFVAVCPELGIGLGVPRDPIRIISKNGSLRLIQPNTKKDITGKMTRFSGKFLESLGDVDGFILKNHSPSCGIRGVKVYRSLKTTVSTSRTTGFFAKEAMKRYPDAAIESEDRLSSAAARRRFLAKITARENTRSGKFIALKNDSNK